MEVFSKDSIKKLLKDLSIDVAYSIVDKMENQELLDSVKEIKKQHHSVYEEERKKIEDFKNRKEVLSDYFSSLTIEELNELDKNYSAKIHNIINASNYLSDKKEKMGWIEIMKYAGSGEMSEDEELYDRLGEEFERLHNEQCLLLDIGLRKKNEEMGNQ